MRDLIVSHNTSGQNQQLSWRAKNMICGTTLASSCIADRTEYHLGDPEAESFSGRYERSYCMSKRRDFLKTTGAALGGMAIAGISSIEAKGQEKEKEKAEAARPRSRPGTISIRCAPNVKIESIHEAVQQALGRVGCPACGLLGVDLHIGGGDPEPFGINAAGIKDASFTPMG
jgi:hypothetical protein